MAGSDGNRGYLVQTLVALLRSLQANDWDRVTIEPSHESEKVDILWESGTSRRATQVKSSIRQFTKPNVERWAKELEANTVANELELILVGPASPAVTKIGRIGTVSVPCPKNLDWDGFIHQASHLLDKFLYSIGLATDSPDQNRILASGLVTTLSTLASQSQPLNRSELISKLTGWIQAISPGSTKSLHNSVLSKFPRSVRPNLGSKLIGRAEEARWLRETQGDRLIVGQPGIGKTFLLRDFVQEGSSFFLRSDDEGKIEQAIRVMSPSAIVVEDAHIHVGAVDFLCRVRADSGLTFSIIADCWPGSSDLMIQKLAIPVSRKLALQAVSDQDIVDIIHDCGVNPSNSFLHMVVRQAGGLPGRATMLVETCLDGTHEDYRDFWNGETLTRWVRTRFTDLIGKEAIQVLACFAIGGAAGVTTDSVATALQFSRARVLQIVSELALGGVVHDLGSSRFVVVPRSIRPILVRDHFLGSAAIPRAEFLKDRVAYSETVTTIIDAHTLGGDIPTDELRKLAKTAGSLDSWRALIYSSEENAKFVLAEAPGLIGQLSRDFLQKIPRFVIPHLMRLADGDFRPLHSNTDHPLRLLTDWVQSGYPGREALPRRKHILDVFREFFCKADVRELALRLLPIAVSPEYQATEQNPGNRLEFAIRNGCVSVEDLKGIAAFWRGILDDLMCSKFENWKSVLESANDWLWPHFGGGARVSEEQRGIIDSSASEILLPLVKLAVDRPGALRNLAQIAKVHKIDVAFTIDPSFDALFPVEPPHDDNYAKYQASFSPLNSRAQALGEAWAQEKPEEVVAQICHWIAEAALTGRPWPDMCLACCDAISSKISLQRPWIRAIVDLDARADLLSPFLRRAVDKRENGGDNSLRDCLAIDGYRAVAMELVLTHSLVPDDIVELAIGEAWKARETVRTTVMIRDISDRVIGKLLDAQDSRVVCDTLEGIWHKLKESPKAAPWYDKWREATVHHLEDDYCLQGAIGSDPQLRHDWIAYLASASSDDRRFELADIAPAVAGISEEERFRILDGTIPNASHGSPLIIALVGDSSDMYGALLRNVRLKKFWTVPLQREPDAVWSEFVRMAIRSGVSEQTIVDHSRIALSDFEPVPGKYHDEIEVWKSTCGKVEGVVLVVAEFCLKEARSELAEWERWEREREL